MRLHEFGGRRAQDAVFEQHQITALTSTPSLTSLSLTLASPQLVEDYAARLSKLALTKLEFGWLRCGPHSMDGFPVFAAYIEASQLRVLKLHCNDLFNTAGVSAGVLRRLPASIETLQLVQHTSGQDSRRIVDSRRHLEHLLVWLAADYPGLAVEYLQNPRYARVPLDEMIEDYRRNAISLRDLVEEWSVAVPSDML